MLSINIARRILLLSFLLTVGCSGNNGDESLGIIDAAPTLANTANFPIGNAIFSQDDPRFFEYELSYSRVLDVIKEESDYVGHDELFRIRETHPTPNTTDYARLDAFVDFAESEGYRIHGHNLFFYSDIGADSWISEYRENGTWTQDQWLSWFEQYVKDKVGRYKGRVA